MRTWFDYTIEAGLILLAIYAVVEAGRIIGSISNIPLLQ